MGRYELNEHGEMNVNWYDQIKQWWTTRNNPQKWKLPVDMNHQRYTFFNEKRKK